MIKAVRLVMVTTFIRSHDTTPLSTHETLFSPELVYHGAPGRIGDGRLEAVFAFIITL